MADAPGTNGYTPTSIIIHWLAAALIIILFLTHEGDRGGIASVIHVSGGAAAGVFLLWRVWYRITRGLPEKSAQAPIFNFASGIVIWGFLVSIVVVIVTGYLLPWSRGLPLEIFSIISIPSPMALNHEFHEIIEEIHEISGQVFVPLLALHILGALKHAFIDRDGITKRMFDPVDSGR